jgi:hypothetical protein
MQMLLCITHNLVKLIYEKTAVYEDTIFVYKNL